ncbi:MAG: hypothetical protein ACR2KH_08695 [Sphingomicrobium sp.]
MRKSLLFLLLAAAAVPAFADDESDDRTARREAARAERAERAEVRGERMRTPPAIRTERSIVMRSVEPRDGDRSAMLEAVRQRVLERRPPPRVVEVEPALPRLEQSREALPPRMRERRSPRFVEVDSPSPALDRRGGADSVREWRRAERDAARRPALVEQRTDSGWEPLRRRAEQNVETVTAGRRDTVVRRIPREGSQPPLRAMAERSGGTAHHWRGDWRSDRRYDWRRHRDRHRSLFRFGFYHDPFGWSYRPYSIGWRLWPSLPEQLLAPRFVELSAALCADGLPLDPLL